MPDKANSQAGAILPLFAILIVVLLAFAALAVDLGAAWGQRTRNQSAVDGGVMAGALNFVTGEGSNPLVIAKVQDFVNRNLEPDVTAAEWSACADSAVDGVSFAALDSGVTQCISISIDATDRARILRVKLPTRNVNTSFARVIGINTIATGGVAEAELDYDTSLGILPFVLPTGADAEYCIGDVPGGLADDPCTGPDRGKFGDIIGPHFGSDDPGTPKCDSNLLNDGDRLAWNVALGLDHIVQVAQQAWDPDLQPDECTSPGKQKPKYVPYSLVLGQGNPQPADLTPGFAGDAQFSTSGNVPGRLRQGTGATRNLPTGLGEIALDNVGLWEYLSTAGADTSDPCHGDNDAYVDVVDDGALATFRLDQCLRGLAGASTPSFSSGILDSPRFALVPQLWLNEAALEAAGPGTNVNIKLFRPVYIQTTFWNCSATECMAFERYGDSSPGDPIDDPQFFSPGEGDQVGCVISGGGACKANVNLTMVGVTAWVLDEAWLPGGTLPGGPEEDQPFKVLMYR